ncbi:molybdopterin molybdotransferase MoeA [Edaphobacter albus]|uniref:molybdopterin molybdotransferase MoeA n=1 Tax=Edaphobacter sp. 4G125 TaxID=2763071 RepID=UPI0016489DCF|nr:gephyrin-like molybdotransferase Glp [Edaphobacter sp. 4G125]QNI37825.1 molybdopterin molybdotransferase MoeA [Edaphobacter sp. 4G125]
MKLASVRGGESERLVSFDDALRIVLAEAAHVGQQPTETVSLGDSLGRMLAVSVVADRDHPPFDRSTRDGFAVRVTDVMAQRWLSVVGQVQAGRQWEGSPLAVGQAIEVMTGAPVPPGADAVVMLEHVERNDSAIRLHKDRRLAAGENIVPCGSEAHAGNEVLAAGTEMDAATIALAAACGAAKVVVFVRPTVAIIATGDELVDIEETPGPEQIRNSNSYGLAALVERAGGKAVREPIAQDRQEVIEERIRGARTANLLLLSGGVSMGEYDLVEPVLQSLGAEFFFTGVKMQPGKPAVFGRLPEREGMHAMYFFGLPGNPVSTQVTFACFVEPLLRAMRGAPVEGPRFIQATLSEEIPGKPGLTRVLPARLTSTRQRPEVKLVVWQGSGDMAANARANCYAVLPEGTTGFRADDVVTVLLR